MVWHNAMGVFARAIDHSIPDFTDPWPVKDVSNSLTRNGCAELTLSDCLRCHHWHSHGRCFARMVPLGRRLSVLHCQGVPESRDNQCSHSVHFLRYPLLLSSVSTTFLATRPCLTVPVPFSCLSWSLPCLSRRKSRSTFPRIWLTFFNGSLSGRLLVS